MSQKAFENKLRQYGYRRFVCRGKVVYKRRILYSADLQSEYEKVSIAVEEEQARAARLVN